MAGILKTLVCCVFLCEKWESDWIIVETVSSFHGKIGALSD
jgi:hypothetical protein